MLNKFGSSAKLYLLMLITAASLIGLGLYGVSDLKKMNDNTQTLYADRVLCMQQLANVRFEYIIGILPVAEDVKNHKITFHVAIQRIGQARKVIDTNWRDYKSSYFTPEEARLVRQTDLVKGQADKSIAHLEYILGKEDTLALNDLVQSGISARSTPLVEKITELMNLQAAVGKQIFNDNKEIYQGTSKRFIMLILVSLSIALSLSFYIVRNIKRLIKDISKGKDLIKESDEKYRIANARFRAIVENVFVGIKLNDANWKIVYRSPSMQAINGWDDETMDHDHLKLIHPDDRELVENLQQQVLQKPNKTINCTYRIIHKNGNYIWIESMLCNKLSDPDLKAIITVTRDITGRKQLEEEIRNAEVKFRTLAERSMVGVYICQKERFTYVNPRFAEIFGYEPHEIVTMEGSMVEIIIEEQYRDSVRANLQARYNGDAEVLNYEVAGKKKDGTVNYVEFYGSRVMIDGVSSIIGTMIDITERKRSEELILREKMLSDTIINSLPGIFYLRTAEGEFLRWNRSFETITGYTPEEIKQMEALSLIAKDDQEKIKEGIENVFSSGYAAVEAKATIKNGDQIPFLFSAAAIMYENKRCLLGTGFDISSRLKAEEELRTSEHKYKLLFESNPLPMWMIAKDDMAIIAANDAAAYHYGYSKEELLRLDLRKLRPVEDLGQQVSDYKREVNEATDFGIIKHLKKDGSVIFVHVIAQDIIFEGRPVRLSLTNDVTEQVKADELLKRSEANLRAIMDTTDTAYALLDKSFGVIAFNQMAVQFVNTQYSHALAKGDKLGDYFPPERFPEFAGYAGDVLKGNSVSYEIDYPQTDGSVFWYNVRLFPIKNEKNEIFGLMLALSDITEMKMAGENLKAAYLSIQEHITSLVDMAWKQSHLIRSPLANLKGLAAMLKDDPADEDVLEFIQFELDRMDTIIIEMAEDVAKQVY